GTGLVADMVTNAKVVVADSQFSHLAGTGVFLQTTAGHTMLGTIDRSRFENDQNGVLIGLNSNAVVRESVAQGNSNAGFYARGAPGPTSARMAGLRAREPARLQA